MLEAIADTLESLRPAGDFATRAYLDPSALSLTVRGVGPIALPLTKTTARKLIERARPAAHGWRDETRVDPTVRDTWEVPKSRVKIDARRWNRALKPALSDLQATLGLSSAGTLRAQLHSLLVYEPGQFFAPHQDTEKVDDMVGTLVVTLPSAYTGGATVFTHQDQRVEFRSGARTRRELTLLAFYADCHHEVRPVKTGYRVTLVYNLTFSGAAPPLSPPEASSARLTQLLQAYFSTPIHVTYPTKSDCPPNKFVYLLDHSYTQHSLRWDRLKNGDATRSALLRLAAEQLDVEFALAQVDIHEQWSCESTGYGWQYEDADGDDLELVELIDDDVELRHWVDASGRPFTDASCRVLDHELCATLPTEDCTPFKTQHEGWMGNYGDTLDRWYHRAAVVLWPRTRAFAIRAEASPTWALQELIEALRRGDREEAHANLRGWLPRWPSQSRRLPADDRITLTLQLTTLLDDAPLATQLLAPLPPHHVRDSAAESLAALSAQHGNDWCRARVRGWLDNDSARPSPEAWAAWTSSLPALCHALIQRGDTTRTLAHQLLTEQWTVVLAHLDHAFGQPEEYSREARAQACQALVQLLLAVDLAEHAQLRERVLEHPTLAKLPVAALLVTFNELGCAHLLSSPGYRSFSRRCQTTLQRWLRTPPRAADDWSIHVDLRGSGRHHHTLDAFLRDPDQTKLIWPLAEQYRNEVAALVRHHHLPLRLSVRRQGSPYKLVLEKTDELFAEEQARRDTHTALLAQLTSRR